MKIQTKNDQGIEFIELEGELDFHASPELRDVLNKVTTDKADKIIIDLSKVDYMDSSGIATFVEAFQKTKAYEGKLVLSQLTPTVKGVFEIAKLESIFSLAETLDEAIAIANK